MLDGGGTFSPAEGALGFVDPSCGATSNAGGDGGGGGAGLSALDV
jgi:hypothetical protein